MTAILTFLSFCNNGGVPVVFDLPRAQFLTHMFHGAVADDDVARRRECGASIGADGHVLEVGKTACAHPYFRVVHSRSHIDPFNACAVGHHEVRDVDRAALHVVAERRILAVGFLEQRHFLFVYLMHKKKGGARNGGGNFFIKQYRKKNKFLLVFQKKTTSE